MQRHRSLLPFWCSRNPRGFWILAAFSLRITYFIFLGFGGGRITSPLLDQRSYLLLTKLDASDFPFLECESWAVWCKYWEELEKIRELELSKTIHSATKTPCSCMVLVCSKPYYWTFPPILCIHSHLSRNSFFTVNWSELVSFAYKSSEWAREINMKRT